MVKKGEEGRGRPGRERKEQQRGKGGRKFLTLTKHLIFPTLVGKESSMCSHI